MVSTRPRYRRPPPVLPNAESLPFPGSLIRQCTDCDLHAGCTAPVPGYGISPAYVMFVGEAPGRDEDEWGFRPFVGGAGRQLDSLLRQISLSRESIYITNTIHCRPPNNRDPKPVETQACAKWLDLELAMVSPKLIVALGVPATRWFLGSGTDTMEHMHGRPVEKDGRIILPCYHPAAGLHDTGTLRFIYDDFQVLRGLLNGASIEDYELKDEYPNPDYRVADSRHAIGEALMAIHRSPQVAVDVETIKQDTQLWSAQTSIAPGTGVFFPAKSDGAKRLDTRSWGSQVIVHFYLNDVNWLDIPEDNFFDTMVAAYLCVARDTPILKADLTWSRADEIKTGDVLVGFDETYNTSGRTSLKRGSTEGYTRRHLKKTVAERVLVRRAECFDVQTSDGRHVVCTGDHKWLVSRLGCKRLEWLSVAVIAQRMKSYVKGGLFGGRSAQYRIRSLVPRPWQDDTSWEAGRLAGIADGEGSMGRNVGNGAMLTIAQRMGAVCRKTESLLRRKGFYVSNRLYNNSSKKKNDVYVIAISGLAQVLRFIGQIRPVRFDYDFWVDKAFPNHGDDASIVSITPVGVQDVVSITTSTGTYIANGLASHNCGLPQGLKTLALTLCGVKMISYREMVRPGQQILSQQYLTEASTREWPDPPLLEETKWDNKIGRIVTRTKKPWPIARKIAKVFKDVEKGEDIDLWARWQNIPGVERECVEKVLGAMPESSLADISFEDAVQYSVRDADATLRVKLKMEQLIRDAGLDFVLMMDTDILPMVRDMMATGMAVDLEHLRTLSLDYETRMRDKAADLAVVVGHPFNPSSSKQVAEVVYNELGFTPTRKTPSGLVSTDDQELKKTGHPVAKGIIEYRRLSKMKGTYADALAEWAMPDESGVHRIHTTLKTTRVGTGRLASADPNLQNIPTRNTESKRIKSGFVAPDGWVLGEGDLAQVEMCTQAHLARCKGLIDLFLRGDDPHTLTASKIFGVPYEDAKQSKYRYPTKRANFGVIYLIGARGLAAQITEYIADLEMDGETVDIEPWTEEDCQKFIDDWYRLYPEVRDYQMEMAAMARRYGYVADLFGRRRFIPEVFCPVRSVEEAGLRMAANHPVTATAQGILKLAMGELWQRLPRTGWSERVRYLMQIHDSLIVEMEDDEDLMREYLPWMRDIMCGVVKLAVPVKVDFKIGKRWGELANFSLEG